MPSGVQVPGGALNVTLNDATTKGAYMPNGSLRVTDAVGNGIQDSSGALRIVTVAGQGVYQALSATFRASDALTDGDTGVYSPDGALRMHEAGEFYVTEDLANNYVTEDSANNYVTE